jgi:hypothetical protein
MRFNGTIEENPNVNHKERHNMSGKKRDSGGRGCLGLLSLTTLAFGSLACAWSFFLAQTRAGETVDFTIGLSFYLGWICGMSLIAVGLVLSLLGSIVRGLSGATGKIDGLGDILPGGGLGGIASIGLIRQFTQRDR